MTALALVCSALATVCMSAAAARVVHDRPRLAVRPVGRKGPRRSSRPRVFPSGGCPSGSRHRGRLAALDSEIPQLLDLLAAGSSAGLAAPLALRRAVDGLAGPLADEVRATVRSVDLGARWRDEL